LREIHKGETAYNFDLFSLKRFLSTNLPTAQIIDIRGFRIISARKTRNWENNSNSMTFNTYIGKKFPSITPEVNVVMVKDGSRQDVHKFFAVTLRNSMIIGHHPVIARSFFHG
jgi:hypothetical protein